MISQEIKSQIIEAMKAHNSILMDTLKMLSSELHNEEIAKQHELSEEEEMAVVRREVKKRKDAIEAYQKANQPDRAESEKSEMEILQKYLPAQMSESELEKIVTDSINESGATEMKDMGKVIGLVMQKAAGRADGSTVSALVREKLSK